MCNARAGDYVVIRDGKDGVFGAIVVQNKAKTKELVIFPNFKPAYATWSVPHSHVVNVYRMIE